MIIKNGCTPNPTESEGRDEGVYLAQVKFLVGEGENMKVISAHKIVLAWASFQFLKLIFFDFAGAEEIPLPEFEPKAFKTMLSFLYLGIVDITSAAHGLDVCFIAQKMKIIGLTSRAVVEIKRRLTPGEVCGALNYVKTKLEDMPELHDFCIEKVMRETQEVLEAESWLQSDVTTVLQVVQCESLDVDEWSVFTACLNWAANQPQQPLRETLAPLLPYIRLHNIQVRHLVAVYLRFPQLFTEMELLSIVEGIMDPDTPQLEGFCNRRDLRPRLQPAQVDQVAALRAMADYVLVIYVSLIMLIRSG